MGTKPRFNHVALTVAPELLRADGRAQLLEFYGEVFGWREFPTLTEDGKRLVLQCFGIDEFLYLDAGQPQTACAPMDHFGLAVGSIGELQAMLDRARRFRERDERVEIIEYSVQDYSVVTVHSFYLRYLLPMMVEIQHYDWRPGVLERVEG